MNRLAEDEPCFVSAEVCIEFFVILVQTRGHVEVYRNWGNRARAKIPFIRLGKRVQRDIGELGRS